VDPEASLGKILSERRADYAEKALLLQALLKAVRVDSRLVWAADRDRGTIDTVLPNPNWFDTVLVMADLDGQKVFLDPTDRSLGFGFLKPGYEGTPALLHDAKKPEGVVLPETPSDQNVRRAEIDLALDASGLSVELDLAATGEATGQARLELSGQAGAAFLGLLDASRPQEVDRVTREVFSSLLPAGTVLDSLTWKETRSGLPSATLEAKVKIPAAGSPAQGALPPIPSPR
jgi:hypothetical protein